MSNKFLNKLVNFCQSEECIPYYALALKSFFEGPLQAREPDEESSIRSLFQQLEEILGEDIVAHMFPFALEFFFSNAYNEDGDDKASWNVIDLFLKRKSYMLSSTEKRHLISLRDSVMSIYEVQDVKQGEWAVLRDILRGGEDVLIKEHLGTRTVNRWQMLGVRVLKNAGGFGLSGAILSLDRDVAEDAIESIKETSALMRDMIPQMRKELPPEIADPARMRALEEKLWAKEICETWMIGQIETRREYENMEVFNREGHPFMECLTSYPVKADRAELIKAIDGIPLMIREFREACDGNEHCAWSWIELKERGEIHKAMAPVAVKAKNDGLTLIYDNSTELPDTKAMHTQRATLEFALEDNILNTRVNSEERQRELLAVLDKYLAGMLDVSDIQKSDWDQFSARREEEGDGFFSGDESSGLSKENDPPSESLEKERHETMRKHMQSWLNKPLPMLDDFSPAGASRQMEFRDRLVSLLKNMELNEANYIQRFGGKAFDFNWLWKELELEHPALPNRKAA